MKKHRMKDVVGSFMNSRGLSYAEKPQDTTAKYAAMPGDVTSINMRALGKYYAGCTAWYGYAASELAQVEVDVLEYEGKLMRLKARLNVAMESSQKKKYERDARVRKNEEFSELEMKLELSRAKQIALKSVVDRYERYIASLSREMSRRGVEANATGRL